MSTFWVTCVFFVTDFAGAEAEVMRAIADERTTHLFVTLNMPIHIAFAVFYTLSLILLLWIPLKDKLLDRKEP
jgi:hypothetical protein